jgi:hypothetical protein
MAGASTPDAYGHNCGGRRVRNRTQAKLLLFEPLSARSAKAVITGAEDRPKYAIARDYFVLADDPGAQSMAGKA